MLHKHLFVRLCIIISEPCSGDPKNWIYIRLTLQGTRKNLLSQAGFDILFNFQLILSFLKKESPFWLRMISGEAGLMKKVSGNISQLNLILLP